MFDNPDFGDSAVFYILVSLALIVFVGLAVVVSELADE